MGVKSNVKELLIFIGRYLLIGLIISIITICICFFVYKYNFHAYSEILTFVGVGVLALGALSVMGTQSTASNLYYYQNVRSVGVDDSSTRLKQDFKLLNGAYAYFIKLIAVSAVVFAFSVITFYM